MSPNMSIREYLVLGNSPGKNPGTSTKVMMGMLKLSQNLTNLAPFTDALMSKQPEIIT